MWLDCLSDEQVSDILEVVKVGSRATDIVARLTLEETTKAALYVHQAINIGDGDDASVVIALDESKEEYDSCPQGKCSEARTTCGRNTEHRRCDVLAYPYLPICKIVPP